MRNGAVNTDLQTADLILSMWGC